MDPRPFPTPADPPSPSVEPAGSSAPADGQMCGTVISTDVSAAQWVFCGNFRDFHNISQPDLWAWLLCRCGRRPTAAES